MIIGPILWVRQHIDPGEVSFSLLTLINSPDSLKPTGGFIVQLNSDTDDPQSMQISQVKGSVPQDRLAWSASQQAWRPQVMNTSAQLGYPFRGEGVPANLTTKAG